MQENGGGINKKEGCLRVLLPRSVVPLPNCQVVLLQDIKNVQIFRTASIMPLNVKVALVTIALVQQDLGKSYLHVYLALVCILSLDSKMWLLHFLQRTVAGMQD